MKVGKAQVHLMNATRAFDGLADNVMSQCVEVLQQVQRLLILPAVDIAISSETNDADMPSGIVGTMFTQSRIEVFLNTEHANIETLINEELPRTIAHEIHHVVRAQSGCDDATLFDTLVTEGLACAFEALIMNDDKPAFFSAFYDDAALTDWRTLLQQFNGDLDSTDFDYPLHFGGKDEQRYPNRAGYWVGYNLVQSHFMAHGGNAATHVAIYPSELRASIG